MKKIFLTFALFSLFFFNCTKDDNGNSNSNINIPNGKGHELLSQYNFFEGDLKDLKPSSGNGIIPYDLNMPLFSDYASKKRFVYVPKGKKINYEEGRTLEFPVGSILIKHFYYNLPDGSQKNIETRLLIKRGEEWQNETYEWNDDETEATRTVIGGFKNIDVLANGSLQNINYLIPNSNECKNCHSNKGKLKPIGPVVENLNKNYTYENGEQNQVQKWIEEGILSNASSTLIPHWPKLDDLTATLNSRARTYLAVNCASCHNIDGSAANSGLYLEFDNNQDSLSLGYYKTPVAAGGGSGGLTYVIDPGNADASILLFRMITNDPEKRMPEIGRSISHQEGITLIRDWINSQ